MRTFAITPDGTEIVFDRLRENSDIVLSTSQPDHRNHNVCPLISLRQPSI